MLVRRLTRAPPSLQVLTLMVAWWGSAPTPVLSLTLPRFLFASCTSLEKGDIWCEDPEGPTPFQVDDAVLMGKCLPVSQGPVILDARDRMHATMPWHGDRLIAIAYNVSKAECLRPGHRDALLSLEFPLMPPFSGLASEGVIEASKPSQASEGLLGSPFDAVAHVGTPQEGTTPGAPVPSVVPALPVSREPLSGSGAKAAGEVVEIPSSGEEPSRDKDELPGPDGPDQVAPFDPASSRCFGPPIVCRHDPVKSQFNDGFGLCSPGRWKPQARNRTASEVEKKHCESIRVILEQLVSEEIGDVRLKAFQLATGQLKESPFSQEALHSARSRIAALLPDPQQALVCPERQPFYLYLLAQSLEIMGDPDHEILVQGDESFAEGVPLGCDQPLPRTPQVFRPRVRHRKLDETPFEAVMQNYESAELSAEQLEAHFRADEAKGLMICTTEAEAKRQYGEHSVLIAAMGAIMKPNGDIRPLHDGTHGIGLNNRIRIQDALHVPGPNEITEATAVAAENKEAVFALSADISQAHRRVKVRQRDWPKLGCKSSSSSRVLWLNTVCTFGVSSSAYWWTRLFGCVGCWVLRMMALAWTMQMVYVDDLRLVQAGERKRERERYSSARERKRKGETQGNQEREGEQFASAPVCTYLFLVSFNHNLDPQVHRRRLCAVRHDRLLCPGNLCHSCPVAFGC